VDVVAFAATQAAGASTGDGTWPGGHGPSYESVDGTMILLDGAGAVF
jgi:hypothetical protein